MSNIVAEKERLYIHDVLAHRVPVDFTKEELKKSPIIYHHRWWRALEIFPGVLTWSGFIIPIFFSAFFPVLTASFIIIYTVMWLFRALKFSLKLWRSLQRVQNAKRTDWKKLIQFVDYPEKIGYEISRIRKRKNDNPQNTSKELLQEYEDLLDRIQFLQKIGQYKKSRELIHALLFVTYKESWEVVHQSLESYAKSDYPPSNIILILAGEEADHENFLAMAERIKIEFGGTFKDIIVTVHPRNIPGEIKGKSANATHASKEFKKYLDQRNIKYENVILSNFDADTVIHPLYFSELTFKYLVTPRRTEMAYQPTPMYHNNIWDVPMMMRIVAQSCTFWAMAESVEIDRYKSFSSRSLSFQTAIDIDYWDPSIIPDDSRQYWTAYTVYNGRHHVIPIYSPVYMDAVLSDTYIKTFKSQYRQLRRWAWGVCDFPFLAINLWYNPHISWWAKTKQITSFLQDHFSWATAPILLLFLGFVPGWVNAGFRDRVLAYNLPQIMSFLLTISSIGVIVCALMSLTLVPHRPFRKRWGRVLISLQWLLVPIVNIFLSAIPSLEAQTRLIFGKYLEFKVTEKARKK